MNELSNLQQQISEALQLLQESKLVDSNNQNDATQKLPTAELFFTEPSSLLEKCEQICSQYETKKPTIRIIHHLACSGGTLISKCLSAMPNVYLLSEVHPYTDLHLGKGKPRFSPSDISSLSRYAKIPKIENLLGELFLENIKTTYKHVNSYGGVLILREHTHSDIHLGRSAINRSSVIDALADHFNIKSILTLRDPIDSYLSLKENGWMHFTPKSFEEYCSRILLLLHFHQETPIFHYESFVKNPQEVLRNICTLLSIDYDENWPSFFDVANITGDSGRSGSEISQRSRKPISEAFANEIAMSSSYEKIKHALGYETFKKSQQF
jgi:hypothetical protein